MAEYDLFHFLINPNAGDIPGLLVTLPGRRPARGRGDDRLIVYLHLVSSASMSPEKQKEIIEEAARLYFETPGSVTSGLRSAFEQINQLFLEHNLRGSRGGDQWIASMNMAVLRRGMLYLAQAGSLHSFVLGAQVEDFYDPAADERGIGTSRTVSLRFFQAEIHSLDNLVICAHPPANWNADTLANSHQISLDAMRRRLLNQTGTQLNALALRFQSGKGLVHRLRPRAGGAESAVASQPLAPPPQEVRVAESSVPAQIVLAEEALPAPQIEDVRVDEDQPLADYPDETQEPIIKSPVTLPPPIEDISKPAQRPPQSKPAKSARAAQGNQPLRKHVGRVWFGWQNLKQKTNSGFSRFIARILPNAAENSPRLSPGVLLFIAVAIPLVVVGIAAAVYIRNGLTEQHVYSLQIAQQKAAEAISQSDALLQRQGWSAVLELLDQADQYGASDISRQLRTQAYTEIDRIDNVARVELLPFSGNSEFEGAQFSRIVSSDTETFLLDAAANRVRRLALVNQGTRYNLDDQFQCSGGRGTGMGGLVDMVIFPNFDSYKSALLAVDSAGGLMVCISGQNTLYRSLPAPEAGFGKISAFAYDQGSLYVLDSDPDKDMVWRYVLADKVRPDEESTFAAPLPFFTDQPPSLQETSDITVYDNQLYLLFQDGTVTQCVYDVYSGLPADCKRTISYTDLRTGQSNLPFGFSGVHLTQLQVVLPPDASVYLLDTQGPGIYHFGLGLETLNRVLRPRFNADYALPQDGLTAFAISQGTPRMVILAYVDQIYFGSLVY